MEQQPLDFTAIPFQGSTIQSTHASWTGARAVVECLPARVSAYLQVVENAGAISDHEAAVILKCQLCSINSIRGWLRKHGPELEPDGFDLHVYWEGGRERTTRRTRWKLRA
jgi:hypothetical protein